MRNSWFLYLYNFLRKEWLAKFIDRIEYYQYKHIEEKLYNIECYDSILQSYISLLNNNLLPLLGLQKLPDLEDYGAVSGCNIFNACAFPCFGVNYITLTDGVFFHAHTIIRTLQPLLTNYVNNLSLANFIYSKLERDFRKVSVGYIVNDRTLSFLPIRFIPTDDSLLESVELFIVSHEYAHLIFRENDLGDVPFQEYYTEKQISLILANDEVAADALALIILKKYTETMDKENAKYSLYGPCFLFKILACYDSIEEISPTSSTHPCNSERHKIIKQFIETLDYKDLYSKCDSVIDDIWQRHKTKIKKKVVFIRNRYSRLHEIYTELNSHLNEIYMKEDL